MKKSIWLFPGLIVALLIVVTSAIAAEDAFTYGIAKWTVDGGGGHSMGSGYAVTGTIGQPDAGAASGGIYGLQGSGFWGQTVYSSYLPTVLKR